MTTIIPAVLAKDMTSFEADWDKIAEIVSRWQLDIVDGEFLPVHTIMPEDLLDFKTKREMEIHLMVSKPEEWVERCFAAGARAVYGQVEEMKDVSRFIGTVLEKKMRVGLAYDLDTSIESLKRWHEAVDAVLLMSVPAGSQGQRFDETVLKKIARVREISEELTIVVDGGLGTESIKKCLAVGGRKMEFAVGSEILRATVPVEAYRKLEKVG